MWSTREGAPPCSGPDIAPTAPESAAATSAPGRGDDAGGERRGVHAVLGGGDPVGVDGLDVLRVGLAAPADHEALGDGAGLVDLALRHHRLVEAAGRLPDERQGHDGGAGEVVAHLVGVDVERRLEAPHRGEHGERGLDVDAYVPGVHRQGIGLGRRQAGVELVVDEQAPDVAEVDVPDEVVDVDAAVAQRPTLLVRLGDGRLEGDDALEAGLEVGVGRAVCHVRSLLCRRYHRGVEAAAGTRTDGRRSRLTDSPYAVSRRPDRVS